MIKLSTSRTLWPSNLNRDSFPFTMGTMQRAVLMCQFLIILKRCFAQGCLFLLDLSQALSWSSPATLCSRMHSEYQESKYTGYASRISILPKCSRDWLLSYTETSSSMWLKINGKKEVVPFPATELLPYLLCPWQFHIHFSPPLPHWHHSFETSWSLCYPLFFCFFLVHAALWYRAPYFSFILRRESLNKKGLKSLTFHLSNSTDFNLFMLVGSPAQHICDMFKDFAHLGPRFVICVLGTSTLPLSRNFA